MPSPEHCHPDAEHRHDEEGGADDDDGGAVEDVLEGLAVAQVHHQRAVVAAGLQLGQLGGARGVILAVVTLKRCFQQII